MSNYKAIKVNGKKMDEHRYIMEQYLGRELTRDEVVHHKDGDKSNNDIENLELMRLSEHSRQHRLGSQRSEETKQKLSEALIGHKATNRKLNDIQVEEIRELHNNGVSNRKIAKMFGVSRQTINDLINGQHYKN
jgi:DNA invertase Pin-like site-specific DNA recombinase